MNMNDGQGLISDVDRVATVLRTELALGSGEAERLAVSDALVALARIEEELVRLRRALSDNSYSEITWYRPVCRCGRVGPLFSRAGDAKDFEFFHDHPETYRCPVCGAARSFAVRREQNEAHWSITLPFCEAGHDPSVMYGPGWPEPKRG